MSTIPHAHPVVKDITILFCCVTEHPNKAELSGSPTWHRLEKELYLYTAPRRAWLYLELADEEELATDDLLVADIVVAEKAPNSSSDHVWESRPGGIWVRKAKFRGRIDQYVTAVNVLFGEDAVDPRPRWVLIQSSLRLDGPPETPAARLSVHHGRANSTPYLRPSLRTRKDGKFKIVQISDTHMVTGVGVCKDAVDATGGHLPESAADPLTVKFIGNTLDSEKPDLVVLTGDQLHHDILDTQSALFKVAAPIISRSLPFAAVFGNHDSEGVHALSLGHHIVGEAQMSMLRELPLSLCDPGPEHVDGVGNFHLQILAPEGPDLSLSTLFFLDSHGQTPNKMHNPDYCPIEQSQIDWFTSTCQALRSSSSTYLFQNLGTVICVYTMVTVENPLKAQV
ncbi:hypothetical protein CBER1_07392 [Cercospora berteroae]|uniref:Calcineurin-like phosphoesterase domain-containing protein n=1 Tax=Cercospora berteroae TaxID=357750 RepID=A0A2S6CMW4_9PEZI|nr:hypothetical protein CBER1_07392 [Cercospora berteroae]